MAQVIKIAERQTTPRGRKPNRNEAVISLLRADSLPLDSAVVLGTDEGIVATVPQSSERSSVQNTVRQSWKLAGRTEPVSIRFTPDGFPQVSVNEKKLAEQKAAAAAARKASKATK